MFRGFTREIDKIISLPKSIGDIFVLKLRVPEKSLRNNVSGTYLEYFLTVPLSKTELIYPVIVQLIGSHLVRKPCFHSSSDWTVLSLVMRRRICADCSRLVT